jgi:hypothetical protein
MAIAPLRGGPVLGSSSGGFLSRFDASLDSG